MSAEMITEYVLYHITVHLLPQGVKLGVNILLIRLLKYFFLTYPFVCLLGWLEWKGVFMRFVPVGLCLIAVMQWRAYRANIRERTAKKWEVSCYCFLPLRTVSRYWGWIADIQLPEFLRPLLYGLYVRTFNVNLAEALHEDLKSYPSLGDFFCRPLKADVRKVDPNSCLVSPCDGTVLHLGKVETGIIEQVKGVTYSLEKFLGENTWNKNDKENSDYHNSLLHKLHNQSELYQCVIYLAPGDYHRFHSPTDWHPTHRRHFAGELLSVNPIVARFIPGLFCLNERAVYVGHWEYGFFSLAAVGATNVGSVKVYFDSALETNHRKKRHPTKDDLQFSDHLELHKGDPFGEFRMGSTIVLVFEAPPNFKFTLYPGQKLKVGESLGQFVQTSFVDTVKKVNKNTMHKAS